MTTTMTVRELQICLERQNPDAKVLLITPYGHPTNLETFTSTDTVIVLSGSTEQERDPTPTQDDPINWMFGDRYR